MAIYGIRCYKYLGEYERDFYNVELAYGVFNDAGIAEAKTRLAIECCKIVEKDLEGKKSILAGHIAERDEKIDILNWYKFSDKSMKSRDSVMQRLEQLDQKIADETQKVEDLENLLNSKNIDDIIREAGYEVIEIPVINRCDKDTVIQFM